MWSGLHPRHCAGWTVSGRHGPLGRVVESGENDHAIDSEHLLVRGGTTDVLYYHAPLALVTQVAPGRRSIEIDADIGDFTAHLRPDGSVDLIHLGTASSGSGQDADDDRPQNPSRANPERSPLMNHRSADSTAAGAKESTFLSSDADMRGRDVVGIDGHVVGSVHDALVDEENELRFLVVGTRGFLGIGRHAFLVPVESVDAIDEESVHVVETSLKMSSGPPYDPLLLNDDYFAEVCAYYRIRPPAPP